ncbi:MAG: cytochrome b/b6 domain-containing protein [Bdellovibrionota bacterium]
MVTIREKHSRAIRWCHWLNFPLLTLLVWSGILIYWANPAYVPLSDSVSKTLMINNKLAVGLGWHFALAWFFIVNGIVYLAYLMISGEWRELVPERSSFREALLVTAHDLRLRKEAPPQKGKLNGAQRIAYTAVLLLSAGAVLSGVAIWKPVQLSWLTEALGGYEAARLEHFVFMVLISGFFLVHVAQVIRAGWNNLRAMLVGYEVVENGTDEKNL